MASTRPNFLFIMTDQHRADWLGCTGHPVVRTPHIDTIGDNGTRFDRCYVTNPVCQPNRASLMTGRMPSLHKVRHNGVPLSLEANTFVDVLRAGGYRTALCGKAHLQNMTENAAAMERPDFADLQPTPENLAEANRMQPGPYDQETPGSWNDPDFEMTLPYYGFEHVDLTTFHADRVHGAWRRWLREVNSKGDDLIGPDAALPHTATAPQAWRTAVPEEQYPTTWVAERCIDQLDRFASEDAPFFLKMSFPDPHHPFTPPGRYWDMYSPDDMVLPGSFTNPGDNPPPTLQWVWETRAEGQPSWGEGQFLFRVGEQHLREIMALTCGMISMIDDAVGRVLAHLEQLGLADNTVVVFTSDHGDFLGDHQLMLKGPIHYQGLIRVPFLWRDTANTAASTESIVSTMDIGATILERAGLAPFNGMQGRALLDDIASGEEKGSGAILIEDDQQRTSMSFSHSPRVHTLVTDQHRMSIYHGADWGEIYDLKNDPLENVNLWDDPGQVQLRAELLERMARKHIELVDRSPFPDKLA